MSTSLLKVFIVRTYVATWWADSTPKSVIGNELKIHLYNNLCKVEVQSMREIVAL